MYSILFEFLQYVHIYLPKLWLKKKKSGPCEMLLGNQTSHCDSLQTCAGAELISDCQREAGNYKVMQSYVT